MFYEEPKETLLMHTCRDDMREKKSSLTAKHKRMVTGAYALKLFIKGLN